MERSHVEVMIIGAGPTGLMMACELARYQVPFRIIDRKSEPTQTSNAAALQTRSLELLSDIDILDRFIDLGVKCQRMCLRFCGKVLFSMDVTLIDSLYKYILLLPQCETEKLLEQRLEELGGRVERATELLDLVLPSTGAGPSLTLKHPNSTLETITCDWLIGCDGAHSKVREQAGISFPGEDIEEQFLVADGQMETDLPKDEIEVFTEYGKVLAIFPLGGGRYRLAANLLTPFSLDLVHERSRGAVKMKSVHWASPFWIHSKMAGAMQKGRIFLAGDAAHIHSPVGGQGMNTGLQDAYNLAWKLAFVIKHNVTEKILDSYQVERKQVIKKVVNTSERMTRLMISTNRYVIWLRNLMMRFVGTQKWLQKKILMRITQLDIAYKGVGVRLRNVKLDDGKYLHDYLDKKKVNIVVTSVIGDDIRHSLELLASEIVHVVNVQQRFYGNKTAAMYIVRPDMYVCYQGDVLDRAKISFNLTKSMKKGCGAIKKIDYYVKKHVFKTRSEAFRVAINQTLEELEHKRLANECAKLEISEEQEMADMGLDEDLDACNGSASREAVTVEKNDR